MTPADDLPDAPWAQPQAPADLPDAPWAAAAKPRDATLSEVATEGAKGAARGLIGAPESILQGGAGPGADPSRNWLLQLIAPGFAKEAAEAPTATQMAEKKLGITRDPSASVPAQFAGTTSEFVGNPVSYVGPGGWLSKLFMAGASGAGSEAAGQATKGSELEPWARAAGAVAAGPLAARAIKPQLAADQQRLYDAGVRMTPGQLTPGPLGMAKDIEDRAASYPILGSFIKAGRQRSVDSFNRAVGNQALEPVGERLDRRTTAGHDLVDEVEKKLSDRYDQLVPRLTFHPDRQFALDLADIHRNDVSILATPQQEQFARIMEQQILPLTQPAGGPMVKTIESKLNFLAKRYSSSLDADQQGLGDALNNVLRAMRQGLERSNPVHAEELANINAGWAMYSRIRGAAAAGRNSNGVFTPSDLLGAIRRGDQSVAKGSFAKGDALMQDFAEVGQRVLPNTLPTSGTVERASLLAGLAGAAKYIHEPHILAGVAGAGAAATAPYTRPGMAALNRYAGPTTGARSAYRRAAEGYLPPLRSLLTEQQGQQKRGGRVAMGGPGRALPPTPNVPALRPIDQRIASGLRMTRSPLNRPAGNSFE